MFLPILNALLCVVATLNLAPVAVLTLEIAAAVARRPVGLDTSLPRASVAVLIPAHNEESGIFATLNSIAPQLGTQDRMVVVADNCTDGTKCVAETAGAEVLSRTNLQKRGKGFALDFGLRHLGSSPPEIVIIVDADCLVSPGSIDRLARVCARYERPVQAQYLMKNSGNVGLKTRIAEFAWVVKNLVRPLGLVNLGLPCQLMGSGMAFPWSSFRDVDLASGNIVEDMKLGLDMARLGFPPLFCPSALVVSTFPTQEDGIRTQRTRWEHGHLATILKEAPRVFLRGLQQKNIPLVALAVDLCVPPLALLLLQTVGCFLVAAGFYATSGCRAPLMIASLASGLFGLSVLSAWAAHGRKIISLPNLLSACFYPLLKIPMYLQFVFSRQSEWVRSKRDKER